MSGLSGQLAKLLLELVAICTAIAVAVLLARRMRDSRFDGRMVAAVVLVAFTVALALAHLRGTASILNQSRRQAFVVRAGRAYCLRESLSGAPLVPARFPFLDWVQARLPPRAVYAVAPYSGPPDMWCLTLVLLPALPAAPGQSAGWTITLGVIPPELQARIARHDPTVQMFSPRYVLARNARS